MNPLYFRAAVVGALATLTCSTGMVCDARSFSVEEDIGTAHFGERYGGTVEPITFSPDGRFLVAYSERGRLDINRPESTLRIYRTQDVQQYLARSETTAMPTPFWSISESAHRQGPNVTDLHWLVNSSGIAFLARAASGRNHLVLADLTLKTLRTINSDDQEVASFDIRDSEHLVYAVLNPAIAQRAMQEDQSGVIVGTGRTLHELLFPQAAYPELPKFPAADQCELWAVIDGKRFRIEEKSSGRPVHVYTGGAYNLALSPDNRSVLTAMPVSQIPAEWEKLYPPESPAEPVRIRAGKQDLERFEGHRYVTQYATIDVQSGESTPVTGAPTGVYAAGWAGLVTAEWSADGRSILLTNNFFPSDRQSLKDPPNRPCVTVVDVETRRQSCVERYAVRILNGRKNPRYHYIFGAHFANGNAKRVQIEYLVSENGTEATTFVRATDNRWLPEATSPDNRPIKVAVREGLDEPPVLIATDTTGHALRVILDPNPQLANVELGHTDIIDWKDEDGRTYRGGLYKPPRYVPGVRYPLVIQTHGFSEHVFEPSGVYPSAFAARALAAEGIMVLQVPECPLEGTPQEGQCSVKEFETAIKRLTSDGIVDPTRVGVIGFSRTCFHVLAALTIRPTLFKAASITDGVNFGYMEYLETVDLSNGAMSHEADTIIGRAPFGTGLQQWLQRSPDFNLDKVTTPLQIVALGRTSLPAMWEPYAGLRFLKKPVDLVVLNPRSYEHVLTNPTVRLASQQGSVDWFRFWLQDYEDPAPAKADQYQRWRALRTLQQANGVARARSAGTTSGNTINEESSIGN